MSELEVYSKDDAISVEKTNKTYVDYFLFDEYEIHLNKIPPLSIQEWHKHKKIEEVIVPISGELYVEWVEDGEVRSRVLKKGMIARVKNSIHTIENKSKEYAEFIVYRMVLSGNSKRDIIKNDKVIINNL